MSRSPTVRPRRVNKALPVGLVLGLVASGAMVWQASQAAFTSQVSSANHIGAASVILTREATATTLLNVTTLIPGQAAAQCVLVTYTGTVTATVKVYANTATYVDAGGLGDTLTITVETADAGGYANCAGFLGNITTIVPAEPADTFAARSNFAAGMPASGAWQPTGTGQTKAYRVTATLPPGSANALQGTSLDLAIIWEADSA